jgi:hypothetical protein
VSRPLLHLVVFLLALATLFAIAPAQAVEHNVAGSAQLDYHFVPSAPGADANAGRFQQFDGFTLEAAVKLSVDVNEHLSGNVKLCIGCHGLDADMVYFDFRVADELNLRFGRFSPSFGSFNLRHDPANHKLSDKPLPYDMGRMLRRTTWNNGVLPAPFPDNGVEANGTHWFGDAAQLDYAVYAVMGFRNDVDAHPMDLNFIEAHQPNYFVDDNGRPTVGARLALTLRAGRASDVTVGASGLYGTYDPHNNLTYAIVGADVSWRIQRTSVRAEYLVRRQQFDASDPSILKYELGQSNADFYAKHGAYVEVEQPLFRGLDLLVRGDGMVRIGNVLATSPLSAHTSVIRETLGLAYALDRNLRLKGSGELWEFHDPDPVTGHTTELGFHLSFVGTF